MLQVDLQNGQYQPLPYTHFMIHEPKRRKISAAAVIDRVVHHALCAFIEPRFEPLFIANSYANRKGKGNHAAVDCLQRFARGYRYVLRLDIRQHFASIDHAILLEILGARIPENDVMTLIQTIINSGEGVLDEHYDMHWFGNDDLLAACRPRGLPIGNLTSQFWSNCYLHPFDQFITRELCCSAYLRYVDDFALFSNSKDQLWEWKQRLIERLGRFRLRVHEQSAQVCPVKVGIPWLGFVVYPEYRQIKARKVRHASSKLSALYERYAAGKVTFAELDASVQGWINHVRYADTWGLRQHVLKDMRW